MVTVALAAPSAPASRVRPKPRWDLVDTASTSSGPRSDAGICCSAGANLPRLEEQWTPGSGHGGAAESMTIAAVELRRRNLLLITNRRGWQVPPTCPRLPAIANNRARPCRSRGHGVLAGPRGPARSTSTASSEVFGTLTASLLDDRRATGQPAATSRAMNGRIVAATSPCAARTHARPYSMSYVRLGSEDYAHGYSPCARRDRGRARAPWVSCSVRDEASGQSTSRS